MLNQCSRWKIISLIYISCLVLVTIAGAGVPVLVSVPGAGAETGSLPAPVVNITPVPPVMNPEVTNPTGAAFVPGEVIVRYTTQTGEYAAASISSPDLMALGAEMTEDFSAEGLKGMQMIHVSGNVSVEQAITELQNSSYVEYAEPNYIVSLLPNEGSAPPGPEQMGAESASGAPNDPRFNEQWALLNTGQDSGTIGADIDIIPAWSRSTGSDSVIIAVIDTGVDYNHPDLVENIWTNAGEIPGNGIDDDGNGYIDDVNGWNFVENSKNPMDDNGHGTHCAGVAGAVGNNGIGISGVNQKVKIMPLKVLDKNGNGDIAMILRAIAYARTMGADVISCSWGGTVRSESLGDAIASTTIPVICAAGNSGTDNDVIQHYPSGFDYPQIISVTASDASDGLPNPSYSNYGPMTVDVAAPGDWILSTYPQALGYQYIKMKGTSMATPHVSGLVALLLSVNPGLTTDQIKQLIINNVDQLPAFSGKIVSGGRINADKTLAAAGGGPTPTPTSTPTPTPTPPSVPVIPLPGMTNPPRDLNGDGRYEDVNGNGIVDSADVVLYFENIEWVAVNEPVSAFDLSGNGRIDFTDIITLSHSIGS